MLRNPAVRYALVFGLMVVAGMVAGGLAVAVGASNPLRLTLTVIGLSAIMAFTIAACAWWWKALDEAAREAHKWAWWWGSTISLAIGGVLLITLTMAVNPAQIDQTLRDTTAMNLVAGGAMGALLLQCAGYFIAWAVWWLRRR
jgi:hypothetical protein